MSLQILKGDIIHAKNIYYSGTHHQFVSMNPDPAKPVLQITKPVFYIETLHSCYVHMIEEVFRIHWIVNELVESKDISGTDIVLFVSSVNVMKHLEKNAKLIDPDKKCYKGVWNEAIRVVTKNPILFALFSENALLHFQNLFLINKPDYYQRSFWNSIAVYPGRTIPNDYFETNKHLFPYFLKKENDLIPIRFRDELIQEKLLSFRISVLKTVLNEYDIPKGEKRKVVLINRKLNRVLPKEYVEELTTYFKDLETIEWKGVHFLEEMNFEEQVKLFNTNDVFVMVHGAGCGNILWAKMNSILIQYDETQYRYIMYNRLASMVGVVSYNILFGLNHQIEMLKSIPL